MLGHTNDRTGLANVNENGSKLGKGQQERSFYKLEIAAFLYQLYLLSVHLLIPSVKHLPTLSLKFTYIMAGQSHSTI